MSEVDESKLINLLSDKFDKQVLQKGKNVNITNLRLYDIWPSKHRIQCKGLIRCGPEGDKAQHQAAWAILNGIFFAYLFTIAVWLLNNVSYVLPLINIIFYLLSVTLMLVVSYADPGILPRKEILDVLNTENIEEQEIDLSSPQCKKCNIKKPPRSCHCNYCDCCIDLYDHHCPFVNNCIGRRNYVYFVLQVTSVILLTVSVTAGVILMIQVKFKQNHKKIQVNVTYYIVGIPSIIFGTILLLFCIFHCVLRAKGKTTKEYCIEKKLAKLNIPYNSSNGSSDSIINNVISRNDGNNFRSFMSNYTGFSKKRLFNLRTKLSHNRKAEIEYVIEKYNLR